LSKLAKPWQRICDRRAAEDRLAASYPFLTMLSVAVCGWLMSGQLVAAEQAGERTDFLEMKKAAARFYLDQLVPEALGYKAAGLASAEILYAVSDDAFAA
jgi:hypothetical protein